MLETTRLEDPQAFDRELREIIYQNVVRKLTVENLESAEVAELEDPDRRVRKGLAPYLEDDPRLDNKTILIDPIEYPRGVKVRVNEIGAVVRKNRVIRYVKKP
jgi:hypothetical protein